MYVYIQWCIRGNGSSNSSTSNPSAHVQNTITFFSSFNWSLARFFLCCCCYLLYQLEIAPFSQQTILCMEWSVSMPMHVLRMYIWAAKIKKESIEHRDREREISFESQFSYMSYSKSWAHSEYYLCPLSFAYCMHQLPVYEVDRYLRTSYTKCMDILCDAILAGRRNQEDFIERTVWKVVMKVFPTLLNLFRMPWLSLTQCIIEKWKREPHGVWGCTMCVCAMYGQKNKSKTKKSSFFLHVAQMPE